MLSILHIDINEVGQTCHVTRPNLFGIIEDLWGKTLIGVNVN